MLYMYIFLHTILPYPETQLTFRLSPLVVGMTPTQLLKRQTMCGRGNLVVQADGTP